MILLIPAFEPDGKLTELIRAAGAADPTLVLVVVDDGSGPASLPVFAQARQLGAVVVRHAGNRGKGAALKTGIALIRQSYPNHDVVCADCDGQHRIGDIIRVADRIGTPNGAMVLGMRSLSGAIPVRSRLGNAVSRRLFRLTTGRALPDTQTGLRGYPAGLLNWVQSVCGDRYEYEFNVLLEACRTGREIVTLEISTVYLAGNASSHFRPVADSIRIYAPLLRFVASSLSAFAIDAVALLALTAATGSLLFAVVGARVLSSTANFLINRGVVFAHGRDRAMVPAAAGYFALAIALLAVNYLLLLGLTTVGLPLLMAKVLTDFTLLLISYAVQARLLFAGRRRTAPTAMDQLIR